MPTIRSKFETFIGFAIRKRALITGLNSVESLKRAYLILVCESASENTKKQALDFARKFNCEAVLCKIPLEDITGKLNCKIAAVTDKNLAVAAVNNSDENFSVISGGKVR